MDIDPGREAQKIKLGLILIVAFIVSTFYSCEELKFARRGKTTEAVYDGINETRGRRGRTSLQVYYHYHDDHGELHRGITPMPTGFEAPTNDRLQVEYIEGRSRLAGQRNLVPIIIFFVLLGAMIIAVTMFVLHVRRETRGP